jgi:glycine dehydrogenase
MHRTRRTWCPRANGGAPIRANSLRQQKYWPPVARVDNVYGDKHVFCSCVPIEAFREEAEA